MWIFLSDGLCFSCLEGKDFLFAIVEDSQITLVFAGDGCLNPICLCSMRAIRHSSQASYLSCLPFLGEEQGANSSFHHRIASASRKHLQFLQVAVYLKWWMGIEEVGIEYRHCDACYPCKPRD